MVWELADGDRIAFENLSDVLTARHFRQSIMCHAGAPVVTEPVPERAQRLHWSVRPNAEPFEVGLLADAFAELDRRAPARGRLRRAAGGRSTPIRWSSARRCSTASGASG